MTLKLGWYVQTSATFTPQDKSKKPMIVHLYIAKKSNPNWLGEATVDQIANQVSFDLSELSQDHLSFFQLSGTPWYAGAMNISTF